MAGCTEPRSYSPIFGAGLGTDAVAALFQERISPFWFTQKSFDLSKHCPLLSAESVRGNCWRFAYCKTISSLKQLSFSFKFVTTVTSIETNVALHEAGIGLNMEL